MPKSIVIDISKCTGCGYCELICSFAHHDEFNPLKARIRVNVFIEKSMAVPVVCYQCEGPWCAKACPTAAITYVDIADTGLERMRAWAQRGEASTARFNAPVPKDLQNFERVES